VASCTAFITAIHSLAVTRPALTFCGHLDDLLIPDDAHGMIDPWLRVSPKRGGKTSKALKTFLNRPDHAQSRIAQRSFWLTRSRLHESMLPFFAW
jgi:hypothetical protein